MKLSQQQELLFSLLWACVIAFQSTSAIGDAEPPKPQRGVLLSDLPTAEELFRAYAIIKDEYDRKAFGPEEDWKVLRETTDGVQIALLHHPSDPTCPYVRMSAAVPGSVDDVWGSFRLSNWDRFMGAVDPFYEGLTILDHQVYGDVDLILARKRAKRLIAFGKRDFLFVSVSDVTRPDGVRVSGTVSVVTPMHPRVPGYTRAFQDSVGFYAPMPDDPDTGEPRTALTIVCRIDLNDSAVGGEGGMIPMWLYVQTIGRTGSASMNKMRRQLRLEMEERRLEQEKKRQEEQGSCQSETGN